MSHCTSCQGASVTVETVPEYNADILGAPFKVTLKSSIKVEVCTGCGAVLNTAIPDPEGLMYAVLFTRALHPRKLDGAEIKFLRNVMNWKAKKLADELCISAEHLSRCEQGHVRMSDTTERLFRFLAILNPQSSPEVPQPDQIDMTDEKAKIIKDAFDDIIDGLKNFRFETIWDSNESLELTFWHGRRQSADGLGDEEISGKWKPEKRAA